MKYKVGDKVRIKDIDWYNKNKNILGNVECGGALMTFEKARFCGKIVTISNVSDVTDTYGIEEDNGLWRWIDEMIECKVGRVEEESNIDLTVKGEETKERIEITIPEGYEYVIESGKIIFTKKKKEYPKTYTECSDILSVYTDPDISGYKGELLWAFQKLLICRDAYWKIAGEEMGLEEPWEPTMETVYCISRNDNVMKCSYRGGKSNILEFPTPEMRDAFYENFKELIEICKELL